MNQYYDGDFGISVSRLSRGAAEGHLLDINEAVEAIRTGSKIRTEAWAWPDGLDRSIIRTLPLQLRTRNCLRNANLMEGNGPITLRQLLNIPNFGQRSLQDFLFATENWLSQLMRTGNADSSELDERLRTHRSDSSSPSTKDEASRIWWERVGMALKPPLTAAAELYGAKTLTDVLNPEFMRLAGRMDAANAIGMIGISDLIQGTKGFASTALNHLSQTLDAASATEHIIIRQRLLRIPRATLDEISCRAGVSRERIRQIQSRIERKFQNALGEEGRIIVWSLKEQLGSVVAQSELDQRIDGILPTGQSLARTLLRRTLINEMGFTLDDRIYLDEPAQKQLKDIHALSRRIADDVGILDEQQLLASLPDEKWRRFWKWARNHCGIHDLFGSTSIRDSRKAQVKAALISIGHPATCEEIARICGLSENSVRWSLRTIPSVVKADKKRWGIKNWVDDEYEGIAKEIIQRIEEDGGITNTERLLTELPGKFGVNPMSVRACMQAQKFVIRDGWISLANPASIQSRNLDDVIDGRDCSDNPYWTFAVQDRFFDGYSVAGVPPEFAKALGCAPDSGERVRIENLPDCFELSIRWPLSSPSGASIGYLAGPLKHLGIEAGRRARVTIKGYLLVKLDAEGEDTKNLQISGADAILNRMMRRRRIM